MKKINFKKLAAKNFFCYGKEGVSVDFSNYGNVVIIKGKNLDVSPDENDEKHSSNGVGKSSIIDAIVYGLFGKTVKNPSKIKQADVINNQVGKNLEVEVIWDDYRVVRTRKPDSLRLWKSETSTWDDTTEITLGGMPATQKEIENILGLNYETFINIVVFTDDSTSSFLECDAASKRQIVENLLSLEKYRNYNENAKKMYKEHKEKIKVQERECSFAERTVEEERKNVHSLESSKKNWVKQKEDEIKKLKDSVFLLETEIKKLLETDNGLSQYEAEQAKIPDMEAKIQEQTALIEKIENKMEEVITKFEEEKNAKSSLDAELTPLNHKQSSLKSKQSEITVALKKLNTLEPGVKCGHCHSVIDTSNYQQTIDSHKKEQEEISTSIEELNKSVQEKTVEIKVKTDSMTLLAETHKKLKAGLAKTQQDKKLNNDQVDSIRKMKKPESETKLAGLNSRKDTIVEQIKEKELEVAGSNPYEELLEASIKKFESACQDVAQKKEDYNKLVGMNSYFDFWIEAFGDSGIRKYVIDEIVPALNENINYWMQFLIEGNMKIDFNNEFEETITKSPRFEKDIKYYALSSGQKGRVNLALSQAFAHIMSLNTGRTPSLVFLDEVTSNIDVQGVNGIINMIQELAKDKQVWLITHHDDLLDALAGCDTVNLVLKDGITKMEN